MAASLPEAVKVSLESGGNTGNEPRFPVPVDAEHKSKVIRIWSFAQPHMRAMHISWFIFFMTFFATFAPAALLPIIRDNLGADKWQLGNAGVAAVIGAIVCRMGMGAILDTFGPRIGTAATVLIFSPAVFCMSLVTTTGAFTAVRLFIGCSLCMFVCCQYWCGSMFNVRIVGTANAIAAGWGNMGGGATALIMPLLYEGFRHQVPGFSAWRWAFFIPGAIYIICGIFALLFGQDAPDGDFRDLKKSGQMAKKGNLWASLKCAITNYRSWVLMLTYGYCFGVELTVDNIIVSYLYDQFGMNLATAGGLGAVFGLMNIFSRASGGLLSDIAASRFGMRGRLWCLWLIQMLGGAFCLIMGKVDYSEGATIAVMIIFSIFCQQACGATYGVVPFVSRRAYGAVSGIVGGGGNVGSVVTQVIFFVGSKSSPNLTTQEGLVWMGVMIMGVTMLLFSLYWPMWGSMLTPGNDEYAEEDYYLKEWSPEEVSQNLHSTAMKFAMESRSQRGFKAAQAGVLSSAAINATSGMPNNDHSVHGSKRGQKAPPGPIAESSVAPVAVAPAAAQ